MMSSKDESSIFKLIPRLGRRAGHASIQEQKSDDDTLGSPDSTGLLSGKTSAKGPAPVAPPRTRKTGWGDELKSAKQRSIFSTIDPDRILNNDKKATNDDIPIIPDIDELVEETNALDISNAPLVGINRTASAYKELDADLLKNKLFSMYDNVDLSLLTEKMYPEHLVQEPDEVWNWESLFTQVASEINSDSQAKVEEKH